MKYFIYLYLYETKNLDIIKNVHSRETEFLIDCAKKYFENNKNSFTEFRLFNENDKVDIAEGPYFIKVENSIKILYRTIQTSNGWIYNTNHYIDKEIGYLSFSEYSENFLNDMEIDINIIPSQDQKYFQYSDQILVTFKNQNISTSFPIIREYHSCEKLPNLDTEYHNKLKQMRGIFNSAEKIHFKRLETIEMMNNIVNAIENNISFLPIKMLFETPLLFNYFNNILTIVSYNSEKKEYINFKIKIEVNQNNKKNIIENLIKISNLLKS